MSRAGSPGVDPALDAFMAELGSVVFDSTPLDVLLDRVVRLARQTVAGAAEVSVTLIEDGRPRTAAFTGELAGALDASQYAAGTGPCLDAATDGSLVLFSCADASRYPVFGAAARDRGVRHVLSVGLRTHQTLVGGLNVYATRPEGFDEPAREHARSLATYAGTALANASLYRSKAELAENLQAALASRAVIEQAKGILMAQHRCPADRAFALLSEASQRSNRKLRDIAQGVVDSVVDDAGTAGPDGSGRGLPPA